MSNERRRYYRIDDQVRLSATAIDPDRFDSELSDFWENEHEFSIHNNYNFEIEQHISDRRKVEQKIPELGRYLRVLEKQIDRISEKLASQDGDQGWIQKEANISAQGISFHHDQRFSDKACIQLNLMLLPNKLQLMILARLVKVEDSDGHAEGKYRISLDFENIHEADQEILIKHIHQRQQALLGELRESKG
jgi:hypothetical protein